MKIYFSILLLICVAFSGCASKKKQQANIRRAYAAGEQAAHAQMQHAQEQQQQQTPQQTLEPTDPQIRILGAVRNPVLLWSEGLTLAHAIVEAGYLRTTTPSAITIYRNNQPLQIDPQRVLAGEDYPLFPGDIVHIQD